MITIPQIIRELNKRVANLQIIMDELENDLTPDKSLTEIKDIWTELNDRKIDLYKLKQSIQFIKIVYP